MAKRILSAALMALIGPRNGIGRAQKLTPMVIATGVDPSFSQFYVAKQAKLFERNGLDVQINTGASGSAMVPFLINNQVNAAYGSDLAGVVNHNVDANVVAVADGTYLRKWLAVVGRNNRRPRRLEGQARRRRQGHRQRHLLVRRDQEVQARPGRLQDRRCRGARDAGRHRARRYRRLLGLGALADPHPANRPKTPRSWSMPKASSTTATIST
ncbi:MAG: ABC transporter substrate-binding protein [Pseudomonadota bacterium]